VGAVVKGLVGASALGPAGLAYAVTEAHRYILRRVNVPLGQAHGAPIKVLHLSDLHLTPRHKGRVAWVQSLAALEPDLVVVTGDFLAHQQAVPVVMSALDPLLGIRGLFVLGSNDYYAPTPVQPWKYLRGPSEIDAQRPELPWGELVKGLTAAGWHDLSNARSSIDVAGRHWDVRGVDDPHIERDRYDAVAGPFDADADLRLGVAHAPYLRVLDAMAADRADLILAGHTHGGQLCIPGVGALVTNCDLDTKRAKGLSRHSADDASGAYLHVSAGLGTSPYAPVRFACPPEATLLTLTGSLG
jgi:predicted MPP superfamily phosphohydrolase